MGSMPSDNHNSSGPFGTSFQIIPGVQSYDWGKLAKDGSLVAEFAEATKEMDFKKESDQAYAEVSASGGVVESKYKSKNFS
jgi:hypothetical protein